MHCIDVSSVDNAKRHVSPSLSRLPSPHLPRNSPRPAFSATARSSFTHRLSFPLIPFTQTSVASAARKGPR
jgi:hypothetical protein